jgi:N-acetylmuramoyl-L-alanine amidase
VEYASAGMAAAGKRKLLTIGFEICEDGLSDPAYFSAVYKEAVELCVYLCKQYGLTEKNIICHCEGCKLGIASNHGDVMHWFPKHGKNMDTFRADVKKGWLTRKQPAPTTPTTPKKYYRVQLGAFSVKANADAMLKKVKAAGFTTLSSSTANKGYPCFSAEVHIPEVKLLTYS